jgi:hypothetical protein
MSNLFTSNSIRSIFKNIDWVLLVAVLLIASAGLITMNSFVGNSRFGLGFLFLSFLLQVQSMVVF